jgi:hypothetical protein
MSFKTVADPASVLVSRPFDVINFRQINFQKIVKLVLYLLDVGLLDRIQVS